MRCSSFEPLLEGYVEGELLPAERVRVAAHVAGCPECASLLEEFRVIDALFLQPRRLDPAANFTFKVMAEVRSLPRPHVHHTPPLPVLATYLAFGWVAIGSFLMFGGGAARATLAWLSSAPANFGAGLGTLAAVSRHLFGHQAFGVTAMMGGLLAGDAIVAAAVVAIVVGLRGRRVLAETGVEGC
jgi:anti-sigma factor RsiW